MENRRLALATLLLSVALYIASLSSTAFCTDPKHLQGKTDGCYVGLEALLWGTLGLLTPSPANLTWIANLVLLSSWGFILVGMKKASASLCFIALLVAASFVVMTTIRRPPADMTPAIDYPITSLAIGYWLWLASMGCALVAALFLSKKRPIPS